MPDDTQTGTFRSHVSHHRFSLDGSRQTTFLSCYQGMQCFGEASSLCFPLLILFAFVFHSFYSLPLRLFSQTQCLSRIEIKDSLEPLLFTLLVVALLWLCARCIASFLVPLLCGYLPSEFSACFPTIILASILLLLSNHLLSRVPTDSFGLAVHFKVYPVVFAPAIVLWLGMSQDTHARAWSATADWLSLARNVIGQIRRFPTRKQAVFVACSVSSFTVLTGLCYLL